MKTRTIPVAALEPCDRVRVRAQKPKVSSEVVQGYAEAYECGLITEPLDVFQEKGTERYIVADGENRLLALQRAKIQEIECRLHSGDELAALDFAIGCNQQHGLQRTKADKYHAFVRIMDTPLRDKYRTDTELSEKIGVSLKTIQRYKAEWRDSFGGNRKAKSAAKEQAGKHTAEPDSDRFGSNSSTETKSKKGASKKPPMTPEQKKAAKEMQEAAKRERLDTTNRNTFVEGLSAIRSIPHDGTVAAKKWPDIDEAQVRYVREWCDEFLRAREKAAA